MNDQYRTHLLMVFIIKDYARLIRWDRSGALITVKISFNEKPDLLAFFIRYNNASREDRGHDCTVGPATEDEVKRARIVAELKEAKSLLAVDHLGNRYIIRPPESSRMPQQVQYDLF
jgi:hypothetical protein